MTTTQALLDETHPIIQKAGASFYFTPETSARAEALGIDMYRFYFLGRGGLLGDVDAAAVSSAFGYFAPGLVAHMWDTAREVVSPRDAGRAHLGCAHEHGRAQLGAVASLDRFCDAAGSVVAAADADALALFAGVRTFPEPEDPPARAMHLLVALRELRGSAHLVALRATGLPSKVAHFLKRPADFAMFGWKEHEAPAVGDDERRKLKAAEALTDALVAPAFDVLDDAARTVFCDVLDHIGRALSPPG
ncbi:MAG: SCO6745 family protein [Acidimicrobiales bacterium]